MAILCARPIPDSSMPPHQTGIEFAWQRSCMRFAAACPPTRPELDIDDAACFHFDGGASMVEVVDAFVEADGRLELALQLDVRKNVVIAERLLDHDQVEGVERLEQRRVGQRVGGVGVDHEPDARELLAAAR